MRRPSSAEFALFLTPLVLVPLAIYGNRWKVAVTPTPTPIPRPTLTPPRNLYNNYWTNMESVMPSPDGKWIYTGDAGNGMTPNPRFSQWDARTGALVRRFGKLGLNDGSTEMSPDGRIIAYGYGGEKGEKVVLIDVASGQEKGQFLKHQGNRGSRGYGDFALNNELIAIPTDDDVRLIRIEDKRVVGRLRHRASDYYPRELHSSPDGRYLVWTGRQDHSLDSYANGNSSDEVVWFDWKTKKRLGAVEFSQCLLVDAHFSGDGRVLLILGSRCYWVKGRAGNNAVAFESKMWGVDARSGKKLWDLRAQGSLGDVQVSPDGRLFSISKNAYGGPDVPQNITIREVATGREKAVLPVNSFATAWSPDSSRLYFAQGALEYVEELPNGSWTMRPWL